MTSRARGLPSAKHPQGSSGSAWTRVGAGQRVIAPGRPPAWEPKGLLAFFCLGLLLLGLAPDPKCVAPASAEQTERPTEASVCSGQAVLGGEAFDPLGARGWGYVQKSS